MDAKAASLKETVTDADITRKLKDAADAAKKAVEPSSPAKLPPPPPGSLVDEVPLGTNGDGEERSVAGRKKMKGGEKWDMATGKEAAMVEKEGEPKEETAETKKEHEVEVVLNDILKRSPSRSIRPHAVPWLGCENTLTENSHNILQIVLLLLEESKSDPAGQVHHRTGPFRS